MGGQHAMKQTVCNAQPEWAHAHLDHFISFDPHAPAAWAELCCLLRQLHCRFLVSIDCIKHIMVGGVGERPPLIALPQLQLIQLSRRQSQHGHGPQRRQRLDGRRPPAAHVQHGQPAKGGGAG